MNEFTQTIQLPHEHLEQIIMDHLMITYGAPEGCSLVGVDFGLPVKEDGFVELDVDFVVNEEFAVGTTDTISETEGLHRFLKLVE
jgi:hypothetical protein